jgi:ketosteroid isomerase-like protein
MTAQETRDLIRNFLKDWVAGNVKQALAAFTEDSEWTTPQGTYKGLKQIEKYLNWPVHSIKDYKIIENGVGILVDGDSALIEHDLTGSINDRYFKIPANCVWEFKDGKVAKLRTFFDVLAQAKQVAGGGFAQMAVKAIVKASRKGLD